MEKTKNSSERGNRRHSAEFKIEIAERMLAGENVKALSKQYRLARSMMYRWRDAFRERGVAGLQASTGRPPGRRSRSPQPGESGEEKLQHRIAELERQGRPASRGERFFKESLQASQRVATSPRAWRECVYTEIRRVTQLEDKLPIGEACALARVGPGRLLSRLGGARAAAG